MKEGFSIKSMYMRLHKSPIADALYGVFLQDVKGIEKKHPRFFRNRYYRYGCRMVVDDGYQLTIEPDDFPRKIKSEVVHAFNERLNN